MKAPGAGAEGYVTFLQLIATRHRVQLVLATPAVVSLSLSLGTVPFPTLHAPAPPPMFQVGLGADDIAFAQFLVGIDLPSQGRAHHPPQPAQAARAPDRLRRPRARGGGGELAAAVPRHGPHRRAVERHVPPHLDLHLCSPIRFLLDPLGWLEIVSRERVRGFAIPNFGIEYLLRFIRSAEPQSTASLRFDELKHVFVGAEPINVRAMAEFVDFMSAHGMRREAVQPAYGMAEAVLMATGGRVHAPRSVLAANGLPCISVGRPLPGFEVAIDGPAGEVGEILVKGGTLARAYFEHPAPLLDADGFYRTGDLGFLDQGELFVLGRTGDRLKINGESYFAHDFERIIDQVAGVRPRGCVVLQHETQIFALFEVQKNVAHEAVRNTVLDAIVAGTGVKLPAQNVVVIENGQIQRTSSGKPQRSAMMDAFAAGRLRAAPGRQEVVQS